jgi:hypothetical protein
MQITEKPHSYSTRYNDNVRSYLLSRLQNIAAPYAHVHVSDDQHSSVHLAMAGFGVAMYFEGTNILVKVDGTDPDASDASGPGAILFSAHYDSVVTAPGATDAGMGAVTLLQLVKYLAKHPQKRTAIFNFNNGEENGLLGAQA